MPARAVEACNRRPGLTNTHLDQFHLIQYLEEINSITAIELSSTKANPFDTLVKGSRDTSQFLHTTMWLVLAWTVSTIVSLLVNASKPLRMIATSRIFCWLVIQLFFFNNFKVAQISRLTVAWCRSDLIVAVAAFTYLWLWNNITNEYMVHSLARWYLSRVKLFYVLWYMLLTFFADAAFKASIALFEISNSALTMFGY